MSANLNSDSKHQKLGFNHSLVPAFVTITTRPMLSTTINNFNNSHPAAGAQPIYQPQHQQQSHHHSTAPPKSTTAPPPPSLTKRAAGGGVGPAAPRVKTISLHDPDFNNLVTVPMSAVHHLPAAHHQIARLVQCRKYDPRNPLVSCPLRQKCKFVHADLAAPGVEIQTVHVNYVYQSLQDVSLPCLPAGQILTVMAPESSADNKQPRCSAAAGDKSETHHSLHHRSHSSSSTQGALDRFVPSEEILVTTGARRKGPLRHCAHYYFNRCCDRGERCHFVHTVHIDETAAPGPPSRRAPAPNCRSVDTSGSVVTALSSGGSFASHRRVRPDFQPDPRTGHAQLASDLPPLSPCHFNAAHRINQSSEQHRHYHRSASDVGAGGAGLTFTSPHTSEFGLHPTFLSSSGLTTPPDHSSCYTNTPDTTTTTVESLMIQQPHSRSCSGSEGASLGSNFGNPASSSPTTTLLATPLSGALTSPSSAGGVERGASSSSSRHDSSTPPALGWYRRNPYSTTDPTTRVGVPQRTR